MPKKKKSKKHTPLWRRRGYKSEERLELEHQIDLWKKRIKRYMNAHPNAMVTPEYKKLEKHMSNIVLSHGRTKEQYVRYTKEFYNIRGSKMQTMFYERPVVEEPETPVVIQRESTKKRLEDLPQGTFGDVYEFVPDEDVVPFYTTIIDEWFEYLNRKNTKSSSDIINRIKDMFTRLIDEFGKEIVGQILMNEQDKLPDLNSKIDYHKDLERLPFVLLSIMSSYAVRSTHKNEIMPILLDIAGGLSESIDSISSEGIGNER